MTDLLTETKSTSSSTPLRVLMGALSVAGKKSVNEDAVAFEVPELDHALVNKGVCAVIADGVSSAEAGREASLYSTTTFLEEYFKTPDTWSVKQAGQKTLSGINISLFKKSHAFTQVAKGYLCTFTGFVIKSRTLHFFHAGDSRLFMMRENRLEQLTRDHSVDIGKGHQILARAVGMDNNLQIDYGQATVQCGDLYLLTTDGIHDFLTAEQLTNVLGSNLSPQDKCQKLLDDALDAGSDDNISCLLLEVIALPNESRDDFNSKLTRLPFPPELSIGMKLDGYQVLSEIFASSRSQIYRVKDLETGQEMVMKTPSANYLDDVNYIDRFIQEEWIGKRINSPYVGNIITQTRPRTFLYYLMEFVPGITLEKWMKANPLPKPKVAIEIVKQIAKALKAFHDTETIHQDLKPGNILIDDQMQIKVIDFGSVFVAGIAEIFVPLEHNGALGTASYSDPHYLMGHNTGIMGDIYSLATITYELFTGKLPYGEQIEQCRGAFDYDRLRYRHAYEFNPVVPLWFDRALEKAVTLDLSQRYATLDDFIHDVTQPNPLFLKDDPQVSQSRGLLFWQLMSGFWVLMLVIVILLFTFNS